MGSCELSVTTEQTRFKQDTPMCVRIKIKDKQKRSRSKRK